MRAGSATAEAVEDRAARERGEVPDASQSQQAELVDELRVDGQHLEWKRREVFARLRDEAHIAVRRPFRRDACGEWRDGDGHGRWRAGARETFDDDARDA